MRSASLFTGQDSSGIERCVAGERVLVVLEDEVDQEAGVREETRRSG
jgi:hypothetical protein